MNYFESINEFRIIKKIQVKYYSCDKAQERRENMKSFKKEIDNEWVMDRLLEYLDYKIEQIEERLKFISEFIDRCYKAGCLWLVNKQEIKSLEKRLDHLKRRRKISVDDNSFSEDLIERCRKVDLKNFVKIFSVGRNKFSHCINHSDKNPSMVVYPSGEGCHCFSCGFNCKNTIDFIIKLNDCGFREAVKFLESYA